MEDFETLFCSSKFPRAREGNSFFEICKQLGHVPAEGFASSAIKSE